MKKALFCIILALIVVLSLQYADDLSWIWARLANKSANYANYIKNNPDGSHTVEAQRLFDQRSWGDALKSSTLADFQNYLKGNPNGKYAQDANENIQRILWSQMTYSTSIEEFQRFIKQYPDSQYLEQAQEKIDNLQWDKLESSSDINDVRKFMDNHPDRKILSKAQEKLETLIWKDVQMQDSRDSYSRYLSLYPSGQFSRQAKSMMEQIVEPVPVYVEYYLLYDLTTFDSDYKYLFDRYIMDVLSRIKTIKIVSKKEDAVVCLQIGYALSFRDGRSGEDNISKYIESRLRDKSMIKQELTLATYDIGLHVYIWDIPNDCLLAYGCSALPPVSGNATVARTIGKANFLEEQVKQCVENSILRFFKYLVKGKDDVMNVPGRDSACYFRQDIGKPQKKVSMKFVNGPISIYHLRDPLVERYIYYQLQQSYIDIARKYDSQDYQFIVLWTKYARAIELSINSPLRGYGLSVDFALFKKDNDKENVKVYEKNVICDYRASDYGELYGLSPEDVIEQWRNVFKNSYIVGDIVRKLELLIERDQKKAETSYGN
jgi:hypothetical protein